MKEIRISQTEYERLQHEADLYHKQRFTIKYLERKLEEKTVQASMFADRTLFILKGLGLDMNQIMLLYGKGNNGKRTD